MENYFLLEVGVEELPSRFVRIYTNTNKRKLRKSIKRK